MERKQPQQLSLILMFCVSVCLGMIVGGIALWKFFPQQLQPVIAPLEKILPKGQVAGASTESERVQSPPAASTQLKRDGVQPSAIPTSVSPSSQQQTQSLALAPPATQVPTPTPALVIGLQNGDFSESTRYWEKRGTITVLKLAAVDRLVEFEGIDHFVRLASETNLEWLGAHALEQTFRAPADHQALEFWYRIHTQETEPGFDSPCLVVLVNNKAVAWFSAAAASESWQSFAVPLPPHADQPITITFSVGQTGDQTKATWVDIANLYTVPELPFQSVAASLPLDSQLMLSFTDTATIGLSLDSETQVAPLKFTQKLSAELLLPEIALQQSLHQLAWAPDGAHFEPEINSPDFFGTQASLYAAAPNNPWNLPVQLNQLKDRNLALPVKLWLVVKTALDEVLQLVTVDY